MRTRAESAGVTPPADSTAPRTDGRDRAAVAGGAGVSPGHNALRGGPAGRLGVVVRAATAELGADRDAGALVRRLGARADLRSPLRAFAAPAISVSAPGEPVTIGAWTAREIAAAVGAALSNTRCTSATRRIPSHRRGGAGRSAERPVLTDRETEVLRLVAKGLSAKQIATRLSVSHRAVENHVQATLCKLQLGNRVELTR